MYVHKLVTVFYYCMTQRKVRNEFLFYLCLINTKEVKYSHTVHKPEVVLVYMYIIIRLDNIHVLLRSWGQPCYAVFTFSQQL